MESLQQNVTTAPSSTRSGWSRAFDYIIGGTFITTALAGLYSGLSAMRQSFYTHFFFKTPYKDKNQPNFFQHIIKEWEDKHTPLDAEFKRTGDGEKFLTEHNKWLKDYRLAQRDAIDKAYKIEGNDFMRSIKRDVMIIRNSDRFNRAQAFAGAGGILAVALGTVALMKVAKGNNDRIQDLLDNINQKEADRSNGR